MNDAAFSIALESLELTVQKLFNACVLTEIYVWYRKELNEWFCEMDAPKNMQGNIMNILRVKLSSIVEIDPDTNHAIYFVKHGEGMVWGHSESPIVE